MLTEPLRTPPLGLITHPHAHRALRYLVLVAIGLGLIAIGLLWWGRTNFAQDQVVLLLDGPSQVSSGDEVTYMVKYRNNTRVTLSDMSFRFFFPEETLIEKNGQFVQSTSEGFTVDELKPGQESTKELKAFIVGDKGSIRTAKVQTTFRAGNLASRFEKSAELVTTITEVPIQLTLSVPPTTVSGQNISYVLDYTNTTDATLTDLRVSVTAPDGFALTQTTPKLTGRDLVWEIPSLASGARSRITLQGTLTGSQGQNREVTAVVQRRINGQYIDYASTKSSTVISSPLLSVRTLVNDQENYVAAPGDSLRYKVEFRNTSPYTLVGLHLTLQLQGDLLDIASINAAGGFVDGNTKTISWTAGSVLSLGSLAPGQSGSVVATARLKTSLPTSGARSLSVRADAGLVTTNIPQGLDTDEISARSSVTTRISSQPVLNQVVFWNDSAFGASGPLPPRVGDKTAFTVHWQITNPSGNLTGAIIRASLPPGVTWEHNTSAIAGQPEPIFDSVKSEVSWNIGTIPSGVGLNLPKYDGTFRVSVTPTSAQVGKVMALLGSATLTAQDTFLQEAVSVTAQALTTGDVSDGDSDGAVVP